MIVPLCDSILPVTNARQEMPLGHTNHQLLIMNILFREILFDQKIGTYKVVEPVEPFGQINNAVFVECRFEHDLVQIGESCFCIWEKS